MKVTIEADEATRKLAEEAESAQNACNGCGLAQRFAGVMVELNRMNLGTSSVNQHPVTRLWLDKFQSLARIPQDWDASGKTYFEIRQLINGQDVEIEVVG
jgi:hypothetical protein